MASSANSQVPLVAIIVPILVLAFGILAFLTYKTNQRARMRARTAPLETRVLVEGLYNETDILPGYPRPISRNDTGNGSYISPPLPVHHRDNNRQSTMTMTSLETAKTDVYHRMEEVKEIMVEIQKLNDQGEQDSLRMKVLMNRLTELTRRGTRLTPVRHPSQSRQSNVDGSLSSSRSDRSLLRYS